MVLNKINEPKDLKSLSKDELSSLADYYYDFNKKGKHNWRSFWP